MSKNITLGFLAGVEVDGYLYYSAMNSNGLFRMEISSRKSEYLCSFINDPIAVCLHRKVFAKNHMLFFMPWESKYISIYNIDTKHMKSIDVTQYVGERYSYFDGIMCDEKVFFVPYLDGGIACANLSNQEMSFLQVPEEYINIPKIGTYIENSNLIICVENGDVISVDENDDIVVISKSSSDRKYSSIIANENIICWIPSEGGELEVKDRHSCEVTKIKIPEDDGFMHGIQIENKIAIFTYGDSKKKIIFIDLQSMKYKEVLCEDLKIGYFEMFGLYRRDDYVYIVDTDGNVGILKENGTFNILTKIQLESDYYNNVVVRSNDYSNAMKNSLNTKNIHTENELLPLSLWINGLTL